MNYLHTNQNIAHRDLKPANILVTDEDKVYLIDFNVSRNFSKQNLMTPTGEPEFNAPEMLKGNKLGTYDEKVDIWGLGLTVYIMLSGGTSPFYHQNLNKMIE